MENELNECDWFEELVWFKLALFLFQKDKSLKCAGGEKIKEPTQLRVSSNVLFDKEV